MIFKPLNRHVEIKPIKMETIITVSSDIYEEKGEVISIADGVTAVGVGDVAYFDSWLCARFTDSEGAVRYLVPEENIRAVERNG